MASSALTHSSHGSHLTELYSGRLASIPAPEQAISQKVETAHPSMAKPLGAAKGAMIALGLEAVVALMAVCVYEIFRHAIFLH